MGDVVVECYKEDNGDMLEDVGVGDLMVGVGGGNERRDLGLNVEVWTAERHGVSSVSERCRVQVVEDYHVERQVVVEEEDYNLLVVKVGHTEMVEETRDMEG